MPKTIDHDQLFKQLIGTFFCEFLDLFAPDLAVHIDRDRIEFLPQEYFTDIVEGERRAMDLVVRVNLRRRPNEPEVGKVWAIIDCEHQSSSEADFERRMFFYFAQSIVNIWSQFTQLRFSRSINHSVRSRISIG